MFPDLSAFSVTLEWDAFRVPPDVIVVEMKAEDATDFTTAATLKGKITQTGIENIDRTKRYVFRVSGRNESGCGETAIVELTEPLYKEPVKVEELKVKEEVVVTKEVVTEEVIEVTETGQYTTASLAALILQCLKNAPILKRYIAPLAEPQRDRGVWGRVRTPLFINMGLVICSNLHRNS